jgi:hypothetical protein
MTHMKLTLTLTAALLAPVLGSNSAVAETQFIQCPSGKIKTEATSGVADGWQSKPVERRLQSVNVIQANGRGQVLQCNYGAGFIISRAASADKVCDVEDRTGFKCRAVVSNRAETFHTAGVTLSPRDVVNMDGTGNGPWDSDIWFQGNTQDSAMLSSFGEALMGRPGPQQSYRGCRNARFAGTAIKLKDMNVGDYVCVRTSEGRIAEYRINELRIGRDIAVSIGYTTWK